VKQIALQKIPVRVIGAKPKIRIVKALVGLADLTAERQENVSILIKRVIGSQESSRFAGSDSKLQSSS